MKGKEPLLVVAMALVVVGGGMQLVEAWPHLVTRLTTLRLVSLALVHIGAVGSLVGVYLKSRKGVIGPEDVLYLAVLMLLTWSMDLGLLAR